MKLSVNYKKAISYGLIAGIILGSAAISASAAGFGKQFLAGQGFNLASAQNEAAQSEADPGSSAQGQNGEALPPLRGQPAPLSGSGGAVAPELGAIPPEGAANMPGGRHMRGGRGMMMDTDTLVQDGVIDQATADRMKEYVANKKDLLSEMVADGVITQAQADAITAAQEAKAKQRTALSPGGITWKGEEGRGGFGKGGERSLGLDTDSLVESGVLDQATADKVKEFLDQEKAAWAAERERIAAMSAEERKEYLAGKTADAPTDTISKLVEAGILTQEQGDAVKNTMPARAGRHGSKGGAMPDGFGQNAPTKGGSASGSAAGTASLI